MRPIYVCVGCGVIYLPSETATFGPPASAHCSRPECAAAVRAAAAMSGLPEEKLGELARRAVGLEGEPRRPRLDRRAVRGRRGAAAPGGGRYRLR